MSKNMNMNEKMAAIMNAGIENADFFMGFGDMKPGTKVEIVIGEDGKPMVVTTTGGKVEEDSVLNEIIENGYVRNTKLHRRFVTAQMFRMLNYVGTGYRRDYLGRAVQYVTGKGYSDYLRDRVGYKYTFEMMMDEIHVLAKLQQEDKETFEERVHFFNLEVVKATCSDYINQLERFCKTKKVKKCKGVPYITIGGQNIFVEDLEKKLFGPARRDVYNMGSRYGYYYGGKNGEVSYAQVDQQLRYFYQRYVNKYRLPENTKKANAWIDAYKGAGAFYTIRNLVLFHDCKLTSYETAEVLEGIAANKYIISLLDKYQGYQYLAMLKKMIADNNFDLKKSIEAHKVTK